MADSHRPTSTAGARPKRWLRNAGQFVGEGLQHIGCDFDEVTIPVPWDLPILIFGGRT